MIRILNSSNMMTSIGIYSEMLQTSLSGEAEVYSLVMDRRHNTLPFPGLRINGITLPFTNGWFINTHFPILIFEKKLFSKGIQPNTDIIHYASWMNYLLSGEKTTGTIHDVTIFDDKFSDPTKVPRHIKNFLRKARDFDALITDSETTRKKMISMGFRNKITTIHLATPPYIRDLNAEKKKIRRELHLPTDKKIILSVGYNYKTKNLISAKEAVEMLGKDYCLASVGNNFGDFCFENLEDTTLNKIYNASDALVLPSMIEGFGLPLIEAFTAGLPVAASNIPIFQEIAGNAAKLIEPNPEDLASGLLDLLENGEDYIQRGKKRARDFTIERFSKDVRNFFNGL